MKVILRKLIYGERIICHPSQDSQVVGRLCCPVAKSGHRKCNVILVRVSGGDDVGLRWFLEGQYYVGGIGMSGCSGDGNNVKDKRWIAYVNVRIFN